MSCPLLQSRHPQRTSAVPSCRPHFTIRSRSPCASYRLPPLSSALNTPKGGQRIPTCRTLLPICGPSHASLHFLLISFADQAYQVDQSGSTRLPYLSTCGRSLPASLSLLLPQTTVGGRQTGRAVSAYRFLIRSSWPTPSRLVTLVSKQESVIPLASETLNHVVPMAQCPTRLLFLARRPQSLSVHPPSCPVRRVRETYPHFTRLDIEYPATHPSRSRQNLGAGLARGRHQPLNLRMNIPQRSPCSKLSQFSDKQRICCEPRLQASPRRQSQAPIKPLQGSTTSHGNSRSICPGVRTRRIPLVYQ